MIVRRPKATPARAGVRRDVARRCSPGECVSAPEPATWCRTCGCTVEVLDVDELEDGLPRSLVDENETTSPASRSSSSSVEESHATMRSILEARGFGEGGKS